MPSNIASGRRPQIAKQFISGLVLASVLAVVPAPFARSQPPEPTPAEQEPKKPSGPKTLEAVLPDLNWDAAKRGPLLIVNPKFITRFQPAATDNIRLNEEDMESPAAGKPEAAPGENPYIIPPAARDGYNLNQLAPLLHQRIVRLPSLTALAPNTMPVIPDSVPSNLLPFAEIAEYDTSTSLTIFLGTLNEAQWRQIGSVEGIGTSGLNEQQRYFFSRLLPSKAAIHQIRREQQPGNQKPPPPVALTQAQRAQMRVRILKRYKFVYYKNGTEQVAGFSPGSRDQQEFYVGGSPDFKPPELPKFQQPNRLKPGQMDLEAPVFATPVSLEGAKTVGDLIQRIAQASRVELYADGRVARLPVYIRGTEAHGGDILKALCWSLSSTFRKLESGGKVFFLLTSDLEPLGPKLSRLTDSLLDTMLSMQQKQGDNRRLQTEAANRVFAMKPMRLLGAIPIQFREPGADSTSGSAVEYLPPEDIQKQLTRRDLNGERDPQERPDGLAIPRSNNASLPLASLPEGIRAYLKRDMDRVNQQVKDASDEIRVDRVGVDVDIQVEYSLPSYGIVQATELPIITPTPQPPAPSELTFPKGKRVAALPAGTPEEARAVIIAARERGFHQVWLTLPDTLTEAEERAVITAAIAAGKPSAPGGTGVEVVAQVSLLGRTPPQKPDFDSDRTITGMGAAEWARMRQASPTMGAMPAFRRILSRSPDWLLPDSPKALARVARISRLAAIPGLSGIALNHIAPPGLFSGTGFEERVMDGLLFADVGYTPAVRAAFVRKQGTDPADFPFPLMSLFIGSMFLGNHPYLKMDGAMGAMMDEVGGNADPLFATINEWFKERRSTTQSLLTKVHQGVTKARPNLPIWAPDSGLMRRNLNIPVGAAFWGTWDKPDRLPGSDAAPLRRRGNGEDPPPTLDEAAQKSSRLVYRTLSFSGWQIQDEFQEGFSLLMQTDEEERTLFGHFLAGELKPLRDSRQAGRWTGYLLDLSDRPHKQAMGFLGVLPKTTTPAPAKSE